MVSPLSFGKCVYLCICGLSFCQCAVCCVLCAVCVGEIETTVCDDGKRKLGIRR